MNHDTWNGWNGGSVGAGAAKAGVVFSDDQLDSLIALKIKEVIRYEMTPHPVEITM